MGSEVPARCRAHQPCAACRMLRRRCDSNCVLAPYFPSEEIEKFAVVHRVFGASNVIRMIQMVDESKREDTVKAIIYEAMARLRDPVYGSAGAIFHLQKMVHELKMQVELTRARILDMQHQRNQLFGILMNLHGPDFATYNSYTNELVSDGGDFLLDDDTMAYDPIKYPVECDWIL